MTPRDKRLHTQLQEDLMLFDSRPSLRSDLQTCQRPGARTERVHLDVQPLQHRYEEVRKRCIVVPTIRDSQLRPC